MNDRRGFLKIFGAGALIAPIIGSAADESKAVQLIEAPKTRPVELFKSIPRSVDLDQVKRATIAFEMKDGSVLRSSARINSRFGTVGAESTATIMFSEGLYSPLCDTGEIELRGFTFESITAKGIA